MHFREAYNHAVSDINWLAGNPDTAEARRDLAALSALIDLLTNKLPLEAVDYETDSPTRVDKCIHCDPTFKFVGPDSWCKCGCHDAEIGF